MFLRWKFSEENKFFRGSVIEIFMFKCTSPIWLVLRVWVKGNLVPILSVFQLKGWFKSKTSIQEYRNEIQNSYQTIVYESHGTCSSIMWRIKIQPSNSTSCSDNALHSLVFVAGRLYWGLQAMSSLSSWGCILKGYFERYILKGQIAFERHDWRLQSWKLLLIVFNTKVHNLHNR